MNDIITNKIIEVAQNSIIGSTAEIADYANVRRVEGGFAVDATVFVPDTDIQDQLIPNDIGKKFIRKDTGTSWIYCGIFPVIDTTRQYAVFTVSNGIHMVLVEPDQALDYFERT